MLTLIQYNEQGYFTKENLSPAEASDLVKDDHINWVDVEITNKILVEDTAKLFNIHHLIIEDILNIHQLPKFELFDDYLYFTTKMLSVNKKDGQIVEEHLSIVMGKNMVITFQEGLPGDAFGELRNRIKLSKGMIRKYHEDYLFYHIIDSVADHYTRISEVLHQRIEKLEARLMSDPTFDVMEAVIRIKRDINLLRRYTLPMRDALKKMRVEAATFIEKTSINYFQDVADHLQYLVSYFDTAREMLKDLMDLHHSNQNNEMNRVMKTLTVVSAIFIPLTFIAGVYGMNFNYMPELEWKMGYFLVWGTMLIVAAAMVSFMKHKKWF